MAKKKRKDLSRAFNAAGAHQKQQKQRSSGLSNPFEVRENGKQKHAVLNRKLKGAKRNVALSRSLAYERRKRTLLTEFKNTSKANAFLDKRFGEKDVKMTEEEKILERFKRIRAKKNLYDLSDTDKGAKKKQRLELTHLGQSLAASEADKDLKEFDKMMRAQGLEEDDLDEKIDAQALMERLKGIGKADDNADRSKSKKEVMEELIAKAKMFKMQRQREKQEVEDERERLDEAFKDLMKGGAFHLRPSKKQQQESEMKAMMERLANKDGNKQENRQPQDSEEEEEDEYEQMVRSLQFEARAAASDRTMTPEEKAKRELEKLEEKQKELERRMKGILPEDEEWDDGKKKGKKGRKSKDAFFDSAPEEEGEHDSELSSSGESSDFDEEEEEEESEDDLEAPKMKKKADKTSQKVSNRVTDIDKRADIIKEAKKQLPFILPAPETHVEFVELLNKYEFDSLDTVIERIAKSNSIHLLAENREKMRKFAAVLVNHLVYLVETAASGENEQGSKSEVVACLTGIYNVVQQTPDVSSQVFVDRLERMQINLHAQLGNASRYGDTAGGDFGSDVTEVKKAGEMHKRKKGGHKGAKGRAKVALEKEEEEYELDLLGGVLSSDARCWPSAGDLAFFRALENAFPVSDFQHPVVTPAQLLLGQYLAQCPIRGPRDLVSCLCTCQLLLDYVKDAKRFVPEVVMCLEAITGQAFQCLSLDSKADKSSKKKSKAAFSMALVGPHLLGLSRDGTPYAPLNWLRRGIIALSAEKRPESLNKPLSTTSLTYDEESAEATVELCGQIVYALCGLVKQLGSILEDTSSCDILLEGMRASFNQALSVLAAQEKNALFPMLSDTVTILDKLISRSQRRREPMRLLEVATKAIRSIEPLFNENYRWAKDGHDPDKLRAQVKKLKNQAKREKKGVARELRKDAQFLAEHRQAERTKVVDTLRAERQRNFNLLMQQTGEFDKAVREFGAKGAGSAAADMRGRRRKK